MKISSNLVIEIRREGEFMSGSFTMNGIRQNLKVIPRNIEFEDLTKFLVSHVEPMIATGQHGSMSYKKGKALFGPSLIHS